MRVAIIGAGGATGRQVAAVLCATDVLGPADTLVLVPRTGGPSEPVAHGLRVDLLDADAEDAPEVVVATDPAEAVGDVVVVAAGVTVPPDPTAAVTRADLAAGNVATFEAIGSALGAHLRGHEFVLVVSNPVELAVGVLAEHVDPRRVMGMGAHLDSLRFRRELATDLGLRRQQVQALVLGEHGAHQVPCWSTVDTWGDHDGPDPAAALRRADAPGIPDALGDLRARLAAGDVRGALAGLAALPPDVRAGVKPFLAHLTGALTTNGVARAVADLVDALGRGRQVLTAAQVAVGGRFDGIEGVTGVPVRLSTAGVDVADLALDEAELAAVRSAADAAGALAASVGHG